MKPIIKLLRVKQWVKNCFLFLPVFFAGQFLETNTLLNVVLAFVAFSFVASSLYIINDYADRSADRLHPVKKTRPLAAGTISVQTAFILFAILMIAAIVLGIYVGQSFLLIIAIYFVMNIAYTFWLKHIAIVDVCIISIGFLLRIFAGGEAAGVPISKWLVVLTFLLAMILALGKRRGEFITSGSTNGSTRKSLSGYNLAFIDSSMLFMAAITVVAYLMYTISDEVMERIGSEYIYFTTIFVILGVLRYFQQTIVFQRTESPTNFLYKDHFIQLVLLLWIATFAYLLYA